MVSTHSRPKAAAKHLAYTSAHTCFNTQPPEGGWPPKAELILRIKVSTHSRPKAAADSAKNSSTLPVFQHTAARRRLAASRKVLYLNGSFNTQPPEGGCCPEGLKPFRKHGFNTQPPEGGWSCLCRQSLNVLFQHTAARRRLLKIPMPCLRCKCFNTQPPEGGCRGMLLSESWRKLFQHTAARRRLRSRRCPLRRT